MKAPHAAIVTLMLCLAYGLGNAGATSQAVWVAAAISTQLLPATLIGLIASMDLALIAAATLIAGRVSDRLPLRPTIAGAASAVALANVLAMVPSATAFTAGRLCSGVAMGVLLALVTTASARRADAQRVLTLMQASVLIVAVAIFASSPYLAAHGPAGVFAFLAGLAAMTALLALAGLRGHQTEALLLSVAMPDEAVARTALTPILACLGLAAIAAGGATIGTYFLVIADGLGFDKAATANLLAVIFPLSLIGPAISRLLGERLGLLTPVLIGAAGMSAAIFVAVSASSLAAFGGALAVLCALVMFYPPYAIALIGRLDASGRWASAAVAFMMFGSALGPTIGSRFTQARDFAGLGNSATMLLAGGAAMMVVGTFTRRLVARAEARSLT